MPKTDEAAGSAVSKKSTQHDFLPTGGEARSRVRSKDSKGMSQSYSSVSQFIIKNIDKIQKLAIKQHKEYLGSKTLRQKYLDKYAARHEEATKLLADNLELQNHKRGVKDFKQLGTSLAQDSVKDGLNLEEAMDGIIFLKEAIWELLHKQEFMDKLTKQEITHISQTMSVYSNVLVSKIAIEYHEQNQKLVMESAERYSALVHASSDVMYRMSPDWTEMRELQGGGFLANAEKPIRNWRDKYIHPKDQKRVTEAIKEAIRTKSVFELEHQVKQADGRLGWTFSRAIPVLDKNEKITEWFGTATNVTRSKRTEMLLTCQKQAFEMVAKGIPLLEVLDFLVRTIEAQSPTQASMAIHLLDESGKRFKQTIAPSLSPSYAEVVDGMTVSSMIGPCCAAVKSSQRVVVRDIAASKKYPSFASSVIPMGLRASCSVPILSSSGKVLGSFVTYYHEVWKSFQQDRSLDEIVTQTAGIVVERKTTEAALHESEERLRILADNIQNLAWMVDSDGLVFWYNQRWYDYTGTTYEEMKGWGWEKVHHPDHIKRVVDFIKEAWQKGKPWELTFPLRGKDGQYRWFLTRVFPVRDKDGNVERWIGTNTDIEDLRKKHELEQRMELLTEQRNALLKLNKTKDEFIALASHQLRTPATAVKQYIALLMDEMAGPVSSDQIQYLQTAYDSNERQLRIINDLLKTAQIDSNKYLLDKKPCDLVEILRESITDLRTVFELRNQTIIINSPDLPVKAVIDATEIKLVLINLLENASKYSYPGTKIAISIRQKDKYAEVSVADMGVGIIKDNQQRIFDKFTRVDNELSDTVTGTGLGLYWVKQIVELHKGSVTLNSTPSKGSKFTVKLPL